MNRLNDYVRGMLDKAETLKRASSDDDVQKYYAGKIVAYRNVIKQLQNEQLSIQGVVVRYVAVEKVNEIDQYLDDLDNLIDTGHFTNDSVRDYTFHHKEMGLKQFISKGRKFIRQLIMKEKGVIG